MKNPHAVALSRLGAAKGGQARARALSQAQRRKIARAAAAARWRIPVVPGLAGALRLGRLWAAMASKDPGRGTREGDLASDLRAVVSVLETAKTRYALIGGLAVQARQREPRTTEDIDIAVPSWDEIPRKELQRAGFTGGKRFEFSENWRGPGGMPVQFSAEASTLVARAEKVRSGRFSFRTLAVPDLIALNATAAIDPRRRLSKKLSDIKDVLELLENHPAAEKQLDAGARAKVAAVRALAALVAGGPVR